MLDFNGTRRPRSVRSAWLIFQVGIKVLAVVACSRGVFCHRPSGSIVVSLPPHLHNYACSTTHSNSRPGIIPAVCAICDPGVNLSFGLVFWVQKCIFFFWGDMGHVTAAAQKGRSWEQLVSSCRLLAGRHSDAQLQLHSRRRCSAVSQQINPNSSFLGVGIA